MKPGHRRSIFMNRHPSRRRIRGNDHKSAQTGRYVAGLPSAHGNDAVPMRFTPKLPKFYARRSSTHVIILIIQFLEAHLMANRLSFRGENTHECATNACARAIAPYFEETPPNNSRGLAQQRPASLSVAIRLLCFAVEALSGNQDKTYQYIERAISLLKAECDRRDEAEREPTLHCLAPWQLNRVASFIESNLASTIRIQDLATVTHLSTRQFSRAFRSTNGQSPYAHIMRRRVEYAQEVMLRTDRPLSQIALDCGLAEERRSC